MTPPLRSPSTRPHPAAAHPWPKTQPPRRAPSSPSPPPAPPSQGGGAFILIRAANGSSTFINAREPAPAAANATMYQGAGGRASLDGGLAVGIPSELRGLEAAWRAHGRLPWARLAAPAAGLARSGFGAHPYLVYALAGPATLAKVKASPALREAFLIPDGAGGWRPPAAGELCCRRPALADTLEAIGRHGPGYLYSSEVAGKLAAEVQAAGGVLTADDITGAAPVVTQPLTTQVGPVGRRDRERGGEQGARARARTEALARQGAASPLPQSINMPSHRTPLRSRAPRPPAPTRAARQLGDLDLLFPPPPSSAAVVAFALKFLVGYGGTLRSPGSATTKAAAGAGAGGGRRRLRRTLKGAGAEAGAAARMSFGVDYARDGGLGLQVRAKADGVGPSRPA
jgi:hypothetical protein